MWGYMEIHAKQWDYRPSPEALEACTKYLLDQGIIGPPKPDAPGEYITGPRCAEALGLTPLWVCIRSTPRLQIACGPLEVDCRHCGAPVPDWAELFGRFYAEEQQPVHLCPECATDTPLTQLAYRPGAAFGYFMLTFVEPGAFEPNTASPAWAALQRILGTELTYTNYML